MEKPSVFISYNRGSSSIVQTIVEKLDPIAEVYWDMKLGPWKSFKNFMDKIARQDFVVVIISEQYLQSVNCQYEVLQLMTMEDWDKKTMFVVEDSRVYDPNYRASCIDYWAEREKDYQRDLSNHDHVAQKYIINEMNKCSEFKLHIGKFLEVVADVNNPQLYEAIDQIVSRMKISAKKNTSIDIEEEIFRLIKQGINTVSGLAMATNRSMRTIHPYIRNLRSEGRIMVIGSKRKLELKVVNR